MVNNQTPNLDLEDLALAYFSQSTPAMPFLLTYQAHCHLWAFVLGGPSATNTLPLELCMAQPLHPLSVCDKATSSERLFLNHHFQNSVPTLVPNPPFTALLITPN